MINQSEQRYAKARERAAGYASGEIQIKDPPMPVYVVPQTSGGLCALCDKRQPVLVTFRFTKYKICGACRRTLKLAYGLAWLEYVVSATEAAILRRESKKLKAVLRGRK